MLEKKSTGCLRLYIWETYYSKRSQIMKHSSSKDLLIQDSIFWHDKKDKACETKSRLYKIFLIKYFFFQIYPKTKPTVNIFFESYKYVFMNC